MATLGIVETHNLLKKGEIKPIDVVEALLSHIEQSELNAYIRVFKEEARNKAMQLKSNDTNLLAGIPIAVKDNICIKGAPTTCGSKILANFVPPYNATVIDRLEKQRVIFIGKTNMDEFAMGSSTEYSLFGATFNPYNPDYVPGGSSGGSATAVANNETVCALGSDTGGSIRQPASFCGVIGLKPTYGRVSRYGLVAFASSLDQIGTLTKNVEDSAILLEAIAGFDDKDSTSRKEPVPPYFNNLNPDIRGVQIGIPREYFGEGLDSRVRSQIEEALKVLEGLGAMIKSISLPHTPYAIPTYYIIATAEASSNLARYDGVRYGYRTNSEEQRIKRDLLEMYEETRGEGFGKEVKRRIMLGTFGLQAGYYDEYYLKATRARILIRSDFENAFEEVTVIITPTSPFPPFKRGEKIEDPLQMYLADVFTVSINLAGLPAIAIPCGFVDNLPIGMQIVGKHFDEQQILNVAYAYELATKK